MEFKIERFCNLISRKLFNHTANSFYSLKEFTRRKRRLKKYEESELTIETNDPYYEEKKKELERLNRKYNRLLS